MTPTRTRVALALGYAAIVLALLVAVLQWTDVPALAWYALLGAAVVAGGASLVAGRFDRPLVPLSVSAVLLPLAVLANGELLRERVTSGLAEIQAAAMEDAARRMFSPGRPAVNDGQ